MVDFPTSSSVFFLAVFVFLCPPRASVPFRFAGIGPLSPPPSSASCSLQLQCRPLCHLASAPGPFTVALQRPHRHLTPWNCPLYPAGAPMSVPSLPGQNVKGVMIKTTKQNASRMCMCNSKPPSQTPVGALGKRKGQIADSATPQGPVCRRPSLSFISLSSFKVVFSLALARKMSKRKIDPQTGTTISRPSDVNRTKRPSRKLMTPGAKKARNASGSKSRVTSDPIRKVSVKRQTVQHTNDAVCRYI